VPAMRAHFLGCGSVSQNTRKSNSGHMDLLDGALLERSVVAAGQSRGPGAISTARACPFGALARSTWTAATATGPDTSRDNV
jgi:hypothetical protein